MVEPTIGTALASLAGLSLHEAIDTARALGFEGIGLLAADNARHSIGSLPGFWWDRMDRVGRYALRRALDGCRLSVHAPFVDLPLLSYCPHVRNLAGRLVRDSFECAAFLGAETVTIHVQPQPFVSLNGSWSEMLEMVRGLGDTARVLGVRIGIETGYPPDVADFARLIGAVDHPNVGATLDIGHVTIGYPHDRLDTGGVERTNARITKLVKGLGTKILHAHIHDVRASDWRDHRELGTGIHDMATICTALRSVGYAGLLEFELEETDTLGALARSKAQVERAMGAAEDNHG